MNMHWVDWIIVGSLLAMIFGMAIYTRRYSRSVADFLAAGRTAGRYLLTLSQEAAGLGAITIVATFEMYYHNGFVSAWWGMMGWPIAMFIAMTGFVIYRFRQTRALTLAQFYEIRYSRTFRIFTGFLIFTTNLLIYAVFPGVTARFFIYFCGLPEHLLVTQSLSIPTFPVIMIIELSMALVLTLTGGQITIMITDFLQAIFMLLVFLIIGIFVVTIFDWGDIIAGLQIGYEPGQSRINPLDSSKMGGFNLYFFLITTFLGIYNFGGQSSGFGSSPKTPHEARMAAVLKIHRSTSKVLVIMLLPPMAYAVLHLPKFANMAESIRATLARITDPQIQTQMTVPVVLDYFFPIGLAGLFAGVIVAAAISTDSTQLHSIGSVFIQDVFLPFRKKPFSPRQHMILLRAGIIGVAIFAFTFSSYYTMKEFINMFFVLASSIYGAGAGSALLGGLYWKRGTTKAAWSAMIAGASVAVLGLLVQQFWPGYLAPTLMKLMPHSQWLPAHQDKFPIAGVYISLLATLISIASYLLTSWVTCREPFNMDRMLHRGKYAPEGQVSVKPAKGLKALAMGPEFTFGDKLIYLFTAFWIMGWWSLFIFGTFFGSFTGLKDSFWAGLWHFKVWLALAMGIIITLWLAIGGFRDMYHMLTELHIRVRNPLDDGRVIGHRPADEVDVNQKATPGKSNKPEPSPTKMKA